jgi:hypothetical protein
MDLSEKSGEDGGWIEWFRIVSNDGFGVRDVTLSSSTVTCLNVRKYLHILRELDKTW